ncbi:MULTISPECIES: PAS domain S-box protein [Maribacter]|uniref:histidine kinase n=1 Tax=Maribacter flavus TaxID=1658664 RepID=A0ABU7IKG8_9FLAO|nr:MULTISPECIES: PAS domain S-box protein [Maribacter]MDC6406244.1 PAS domain S-box protein [Maribacter sp. PR66]MEE1973364.1 PAS domain S-box protein [Maribacter flavus]
MDNKEINLLKKALERQKKARQQAERILENKSKELYDVTRHLKETNNKLENLLSEKTSELDGVFMNILDPYVLMDLQFNVINMNTSAKELLQKDHTKENVNLARFIHPDFQQYTLESMQSLLEVGTLKNYRAKIIISQGMEIWVQINASLIFNSQRKPIAAQGIIRDITGEMEVKELLGEQKKQLDIIVENSPLGILLAKDNKIIKANETFMQMLGYSHHELMHISLKDISAPEEQSDSCMLLDQMNEGILEEFTAIKKFFKKDGSFILTKTRMNAVTNHQGEINYQVGIIEDISKERKAEMELKASESRLSTLISNLHSGVLLENEDRKIALTNKMFCNLFNIPANPEDLKGADCSESAEQSKVYFKNPDTFVKRIEEILEQREIVLSDELELIDGRIFERDYIPIYNDGIYKGHLWAYHDVTIGKNYKKNLEAQREKYSSIIANMNLGLVEVDNNDVIQMVNQSFCQMSGFREHELVGKVARDILQVSNKELIPSKNKRRLSGASDSYEIEVQSKDGRNRHWLISGAPRYNESGTVIGSIGIHLDITDQKNLEFQKEKLLKELEISNTGLQEYAHIVSHDLKSPLRSISSLATWLYEDYKDILDEGGKQNLQMMQEKVASMDKLIHGILEYSTANSSELDSSTVNLNEVVSEIRETIYIPEHVTISVPEKLPVIQADRTKMYQLFQNIIGNAVVHIEKKMGVVEVTASEYDDFWEFSIKDNGVGIPEKFHKKIFKIFQSIGNNERSTGIGLSIVKKIVDRYEGDVWVESEVGKGTDFHFTIKKSLVSQSDENCTGNKKAKQPF